MVAACRTGGRKTIPLALRLWSSRAPGFKGKNDEILNILKSVYEATGGAEHLKHLSKRMGKIPEFAAYAIADGLKRAFTKFGKWIRSAIETHTHVDSATNAPMLPGFAVIFELDDR